MEDRGVAENGGFDAGGWGDYADAAAGKIGAVLFAGCVAGVEGEGKDEQEELCEEIATTDEHGWTRIVSRQRTQKTQSQERIILQDR